MKRRQPLARVSNPAGRLDVALYRACERVAEKLEREQGILGLREHVLPIVERSIVQHLPAHNVIPREVAELVRFFELNRRRVVES